MTFSWHLLHPVAVHFPIALLVVGFLTAIWSHFKYKPTWISDGATWLLWIGTATAWIAFGLGHLAEETVPHVPQAWEVLEHHETLGYWTVGLFSLLSAWRYRMRRQYERFFLVAWLIASGVLIWTATHGGELVYSFGVGLLE